MAEKEKESVREFKSVCVEERESERDTEREKVIEKEFKSL